MSSTLRAGLRRTELVAVVEAAGEGDQVAVTELVNHCLPQIASYVAHRGSAHPEALANLVMAEFVSGLDRLEFKNPGQVWSYLYRMSRSRLLDERRKARLEQPTELLEVIDERGTCFDENVATELWVKELLAELTEDQRQVVELRFKDDLTLEETAKRVGKTLTAVKGLQRRALASLAAASVIVALVWAVDQTPDRIQTSDPAVTADDGFDDRVDLQEQRAVGGMADSAPGGNADDQTSNSSQDLFPRDAGESATTDPSAVDEHDVGPEPNGDSVPGPTDATLPGSVQVEPPSVPTTAVTAAVDLPPAAAGQDGQDGQDGTPGADGQPVAPQPSPTTTVPTPDENAAVGDTSAYVHRAMGIPQIVLDVTANDGNNLDASALRLVSEPDSGFVDKTLIDGRTVLEFYPDGSGPVFFVYELCGPNSCAVASVSISVGWYGVDDCANLTPTIVGTAGDDVLIGTEGPDIIFGLDGNDTIKGNGGDDIICGGKGADTINGNDGRDLLYGGIGDDDITGGPGEDAIYGGAGDDYLEGLRGADIIYGGDGSDWIYGGGSIDFLYGEAGDNEIAGDAASDRIFGGPGHDLLEGGSGSDLLAGGPGDDELISGTGFDRLYGGADSDALTATDDWDELSGDSGADSCRGTVNTVNCETVT